MGFGRAIAAAALGSRAVSLVMRDDEVPGAARITQWSETRLGPPMSVADACSVAWNFSTQSEWKEPDPITFPEAGLGARRLMTSIGGMAYQLYLPPTWNNNSLYPYPVHLDLHSHGERKWTLKNSQGFARMLARNQSQSFDNRSCWCLNSSFEQVEMFQENMASTTEAYDTSAAPASIAPTRADCDFADTFRALVIMPQGWTGQEYPGWYTTQFEKLTALTRAIMKKFNGDADRVIVTGVAEGAKGALKYASTTGSGLVASVIVADAPNATFNGTGLDDVPVLASGDEGAGLAGMDDLVLSLKGRTHGTAFTRYRRYVTSPGPADPSFGGRYNHSSDLLYRDQTLWQWAFSKRIRGGRGKWDLPELDYVAVGGDHHSQPRRPDNVPVGADDGSQPRQPDSTKPSRPHHAKSTSYKKPNYHW